MNKVLVFLGILATIAGFWYLNTDPFLGTILLSAAGIIAGILYSNHE